MMDGKGYGEQAMARIPAPKGKSARCAGARQHTLRRRHALPIEDLEDSALIECTLLLLALLTMMTGAVSLYVVVVSDQQLSQGLSYQAEPESIGSDLSPDRLVFDEPAPDPQGAR